MKRLLLGYIIHGRLKPDGRQKSASWLTPKRPKSKVHLAFKDLFSNKDGGVIPASLDSFAVALNAFCTHENVEAFGAFTQVVHRILNWRAAEASACNQCICSNGLEDHVTAKR